MFAWLLIAVLAAPPVPKLPARGCAPHDAALKSFFDEEQPRYERELLEKRLRKAGLSLLPKPTVIAQVLGEVSPAALPQQKLPGYSPVEGEPRLLEDSKGGLWMVTDITPACSSSAYQAIAIDSEGRVIRVWPDRRCGKTLTVSVCGKISVPGCGAPSPYELLHAVPVPRGARWAGDEPREVKVQVPTCYRPVPKGGFEPPP